jgi:hypothetical protein
MFVVCKIPMYIVTRRTPNKTFVHTDKWEGRDWGKGGIGDKNCRKLMSTITI